MRAEPFPAALDVVQEQIGQVPADTVAHEDALIPGPRMAEVAWQIARKLHPEIDGGTSKEVETDGI